ncbi:MAG: VOC family protein [Asticcacaulis sp.]|nr:VOC family protein [Asticcacaulis sp.]
MKLQAYLNFDGTCREAMKFYTETLGGELTFLQTFGESPMRDHVPPDHLDAVMHATVMVGDAAIMGSDAPGGRYNKPQGFAVSLGLSDAEQARRIFATLADGGQVEMEIQETFWAAAFGMVTDRFGIPWMINCEAPTA